MCVCSIYSTSHRPLVWMHCLNVLNLLLLIHTILTCGGCSCTKAGDAMKMNQGRKVAPGVCCKLLRGWSALIVPMQIVIPVGASGNTNPGYRDDQSFRSTFRLPLANDAAMEDLVSDPIFSNCVSSEFHFTICTNVQNLVPPPRHSSYPQSQDCFW